MQADELVQHIDDPLCTDRALHINGQTFARVLVHHRRVFQLLSIGTEVKHKVVAPHGVPALWRRGPKPGRRKVSASPPPGQHLQAGSAPDAAAPVPSHLHALTPQEEVDATCAKARKLA